MATRIRPLRLGDDTQARPESSPQGHALPHAVRCSPRAQYRAEVVTWGNIGGYPQSPGFAQSEDITYLGSYLQMLITPLNSAVFGSTVQAAVGLLTLALLVFGLVRYARGAGRLLPVAGAGLPWPSSR